MGNNSNNCCNPKLDSNQNHEDQLSLAKHGSFVSQLSGKSFNMIEPPIMNQEISDILSLKKPLRNQLNSVDEPKIINWNDAVYHGDISNNKPNGYGKLYYKNGSLLISKFKNGQPIEDFFFIRDDGTYCQGKIAQNNSTSQCTYKQKEFQVRGKVEDGLIVGKGTFYGRNCIVSGNFQKGALKNGVLRWFQNKQQYTYKGDFNEHLQMHGKGVLQEPSGVYQGDFVHNLKHGEGKYSFTNGNCYIGAYKQNKKQGNSRLLSRYQQVLYQGEWLDGIPCQNDQHKLQRIFSDKTFGLKKITSTSTIQSLKQLKHLQKKSLSSKTTKKQ